MLEVAGADFVKTARAKGALARRRVARRHVARNAILPVVTLAGLQAGQLVGGAVLTETVFAWPGIGRLMFDALVQRDYPVLLGVFFVSSAMVVGFNILTDLVYRLGRPAHRGDVVRGSAARSRPSTWPSVGVETRMPPRKAAGAAVDRTPPARLLRHRGAVIGLVILLAVVAVAIARAVPASRTRPGAWSAAPFLAPFALERFPLGTDTLGRDIAAGLVHGARVSLMIGVVSTLVALLIGVPLGAVAGYLGGLRRRRADALHRVLPDHPELRARHRARRDPAAVASARSCSPSRSSPGRRWRGWCAARCCRCAPANTSRPRSPSARRRRASSSARSCRTPIAPIIVMASLMVGDARSCSNPRSPSSASATRT